MTFKLSFSVIDLPLFSSTKDYFQLAKELKVDGIELVLGYKTYFAFDLLKRLVQEYNIPILSIHQPIAFFLTRKRDEQPFKIASYFNAKYVVHPLYEIPLTHEKAKDFFEWLQKMHRKYKVEILIENMPKIWGISFMRRLVKSDASHSNFFKLSTVCKRYGFGFTLDTSHLAKEEPMEEKGYLEIHPYIQNIHLSDFRNGATHLSLGGGQLSLQSFIKGLIKQRYTGLVTLEVFGDVSLDWLGGKQKQFQNISESIQLIRKYCDE